MFMKFVICWGEICFFDINDFKEICVFLRGNWNIVVDVKLKWFLR